MAEKIEAYRTEGASKQMPENHLSRTAHPKFFFPIVILLLISSHPDSIFAEGSLPGGGGIDWGEFPPNWDYIAPIPDPGKGRGDWTGGIDTINGKPCLCLTQPVNPDKADPCKDRFYVDCYDLGPKEEPPVIKPPVEPPNKGPPRPGVEPPGVPRPKACRPRGACKGAAGAAAGAVIGGALPWVLPENDRHRENNELNAEIHNMACTGKNKEGEKLKWWERIAAALVAGQQCSPEAD